EIPKELDEIVLKALMKNRRHRYAFASDLKEELLKFLYVAYPRFKPAEVAEYVRELFQTEIDLKRRLAEEDKKTPHLILEKTKDLGMEKEDEEHTKGGIGIDWREFMLEEEWPDQEKSISRETSDEEVTGEEVPEEVTSHKSPFRFSKSTRVAIVVSLLLIVVGAAQYYFSRNQQPSEKLPLPVTQEPQKPKVSPKEAESKILTLKPIDKQVPAKIHIDSEPAGAKVFLDDQETGQFTPTTLETTEFSRPHTLGIYLDNYKFYKKEFVVEPKENKDFHIVLKMDYATLRVLSNPTDALVYIDGAPLGQTPLTKKELTPGKIITVTIEREGFKPFREEQRLEAGKEHTISAILEKLQ
ncbi:MAG: PEGA domain-containing protein, partial [Deltaproteobacteria bacterium]|nr:PEGA domain-containing protein [Deltaproteobacteria bacterium]